MKRIATAAVLILFALPAWADFQDGWDAYDQGDDAGGMATDPQGSEEQGQ